MRIIGFSISSLVEKHLHLLYKANLERKHYTLLSSMLQELSFHPSFRIFSNYFYTVHLPSSFDFLHIQTDSIMPI